MRVATFTYRVCILVMYRLVRSMVVLLALFRMPALWLSDTYGLREK